MSARCPHNRCCEGALFWGKIGVIFEWKNCQIFYLHFAEGYFFVFLISNSFQLYDLQNAAKIQTILQIAKNALPLQVKQGKEYIRHI